MSSAATRTARELLREFESEELLARRNQQIRDSIRERRIAKVNRLWTQRKLLARFVIAGLALSTTVALLIPSQFVSTTRLMPPDTAQGQTMALFSALSGRIGASLGAFGSDLLGLKTSAELFAGLLLSRTVQDDLIAKFDLRHIYGVRRWVDARKELTGRTDVSVDRKTDIVTIRVTDNDPQRAAAIAQEYIVELNKLVTQLNTSSAHRERAFLEARLVEVKSDLAAAEKEFSEFSSKTGTLDVKEQGKAMVESAALLEGQLIAARTELQGLREIYSDNNVRVRTALARVSELESQIRRLGGANDTPSSATSSDSNLYPSLRKLPLLGVTYADLYRKTKVQETVFETLTQQFELAKVQEAKEIPSVRVLDPADLPEKKSFPPRTMLILFGTFLALSLGVLWTLARDRWNKADPQDPGKVLVLNIIGTVRPSLTAAAGSSAALVQRVGHTLNATGSDSTAEER